MTSCQIWRIALEYITRYEALPRGTMNCSVICLCFVDDIADFIFAIFTYIHLDISDHFVFIFSSDIITASLRTNSQYVYYMY